jgi:hypothetical protein
MNAYKKKKKIKYPDGGIFSPSRRNNRRTNKATKRSDGLSPERTKKAKNFATNILGALGTAGIIIKGGGDIKKLKDLR